ncbi:aldo/keto reductase [Streptomyces sp. gCLA4]|uniref:aldo/keto reductase n=1 Tax=Streptomyces sp. gCLA4 TaxID=1873416 RepID=UPI0016017F17|nr:aldo/keto reductase [Streptomyces sp. gCLA4]
MTTNERFDATTGTPTTTTTAAPTTTARRRLGSTGPAVFPIGLGCMGMSALYGEADRSESIATIHAYLDAVPEGVNALLDTGDFYGMGHNELLIHEALRTAPAAARDRALTSVKFGALRTVEGGFTGYDGRPEAVRNFLAYSLQRLGRDHIDVYRIARVDPDVPIEETVGAIAEAVEAGHVRHIGLSEVGADTLRRAAAVAPISDLQIEYSLMSRGIEDEILPTARELGIGVTAYGVLSRGLISGHFTRDRALAPGDFRGMSPRFQGENLHRNLDLVDALRKVADDKGVSVAQTAIAWVLSRGADIVPLVGARRRDRLTEALGALRIDLGPADLAAIEAAVPAGAAAGDRYPAAQMAHLDSEH